MHMIAIKFPQQRAMQLAEDCKEVICCLKVIHSVLISSAVSVDTDWLPPHLREETSPARETSSPLPAHEKSKPRRGASHSCGRGNTNRDVILQKEGSGEELMSEVHFI